MKKRSNLQYLKLLGYFAAAWLLVMLVTRRSSGPPVGQEAPDFNLPLVGAQQGQFHLKEHRGTPVVIEVFASWCGACERATPAVVRSFRAHRSGTVKYLGVSVDESPAVAASVQRRWQIPYPVAHDNGAFAAAYDVSVLPTFIVIDANGHVKHTATGAVSESRLKGWLKGVAPQAQ